MPQMDFSVAVFQRRQGPNSEWWAVGFGASMPYVGGRTSSKLRDRFVGLCRDVVNKTLPAGLAAMQLVRGRRLEKPMLDLSVRSDDGRERFAGRVPLIVEPRPLGPDRVLRIAYHPLRQDEWFPIDETRTLVEQANSYFQKAWSAAGLDAEALAQLRVQGAESLRVVAFRAEPQTVFNLLPRTERGPEMARIGTRRRRPGTSLLNELGFDLTRKAVGEELGLGMPREPYREQLRQLLCGARKAPVLLIGPPGVGKTILLHRLIADLLDTDGWLAHQNLDRVHHVWQISGRRIIAGMSYLGQWEQRCVELLEETYAKPIVLWAEDLHAWGRIGESRQSDRSLASFFRGPVARGELTMIGECTAEQYQQLQADSSAFANLFTTLHVEPTDPAATMRMLVHEARALELRHGCAFDPRVFRSIYELSGSLYSGSAYPGKALELVRALAARHRMASSAVEQVRLREILMREAGADDPERPRIATPALISLLSERTGMPELLLAQDRPLDAEEVERAFADQVMGQAQAVAVVRDLIVRIKAGLCDPGRPYGVFLFTGPTGTGKTEMAKALAEYLFGDESRLVRFDMSEYNVPGAASRLIGDRYQPQGVLTSRVRAQPFCVVLLDEVEKADPSVLNLMLQLFDDGRLTDAAGEVADFRHCVVIMTSNLGASVNSSVGFGGNTRRGILQDIAKAVREFFPPELFNRIDRVVEFHPLERAAAESIARKELGKLLARRGLGERNTFVRHTDSVLAKIVREGFNARDGARSLKRWLEDNVGSLLADTLTRSQAASMRILWLYSSSAGGEPRLQPQALSATAGMGFGLELHEEALREADPIPEESRLGELIDQPNALLLRQVPAALQFLRGLDRSSRLEALSHTLARLLQSFNDDEQSAQQAANALYNLEVLREEIRRLRDWLELHASYDQRLVGHVESSEGRHEGVGEDIELRHFTHEERVNREAEVATTVRRFDRRQFNPSLPLRQRESMLRAIADVWFLERALARADDLDQHVVFLELSRIGDPRQRGRFDRPSTRLFAELASAYVQRGRGELEAWAAYPRVRTSDEPLTGEAQDGAHRLLHILPRESFDVLVLQLVGPSVREFFAGESGCQVLETLGGGHEIIRVRVLASEPGIDTPTRALARVAAQRQAFAAALESGESPSSAGGAPRLHPRALPINPDAMLPVIRHFKIDEARTGKPETVEVEDYRLSHVSSHSGVPLGRVLELMWLMQVGVAIEQAGEERAP
jgi:ATP-dependent Clp protease ATP-binding subunit ClpC